MPRSWGDITWMLMRGGLEIVVADFRPALEYLYLLLVLFLISKIGLRGAFIFCVRIEPVRVEGAVHEMVVAIPGPVLGYLYRIYYFSCF